MSIAEEIADQPRTIARAVASAGDSAAAVTELVRAAVARPEGLAQVLLAARGTSDNAARHAQYTWGRHLRLPVALTTPSLFAADEPPRLHGSLVIGVSQSGASPDLVQVLRVAREAGQPTIAVTNHTDSPLAAQADVVVAMDVGREHAVAATKTYTAQLACLDAMTDAVALGLGVPVPDLVGRLAAVPAAVQQVLDEAPATPAVLTLLGQADRCAVVGRGSDLATVGEWALKLQELSGVLAHAWSTADFRHGPFALAAAGLPVLLVTTDPAHREETIALARDLTAAGAPTVLLGAGLSDAARSGDLPCPVVALPADGPAHPDGAAPLGGAVTGAAPMGGAVTGAAPMGGAVTGAAPMGGAVTGAYTASVAAQLATVALTRHRGGDPDQPDLITKVTLTS